MDSELLTAFIEETDSLLQSIRGGILVYVNERTSPLELETPLRSIQSLRTTASMFKFDAIQESTGNLEQRLQYLIDSKQPISDAESRVLLDILADIEASVMAFKMKADDGAMNVSDFIDESFDILQIDTFPPNQPHFSAATISPLTIPHFTQAITVNGEVKSPDSFSDNSVDDEEFTDDEFEIDEEMLEVFAMEAEDLLKNIESALATLATNPDDNAALWEIRRNAHTFKGAAGIVGLKKPSELAHRVEDLLDYLADNKLGPTPLVFELLMTSTDCLRAITGGDTSARLSAKIRTVYDAFDTVMASFASPQNAEVLTPASEPEPFNAVTISQPAEVPQAVEAVPRNVPQRSIVRVSLTKLDELVKIVRDLVISRTAVEQRLNDFDRQIEELHNSARRLQSTSSQLDANFEAAMLAGVPQNIPSPTNKSGTTAAGAHFDALEFDRYTDFHQSTRELVETTNDTFAINAALDHVKENLSTLAETQHRAVEDLQEKLMRIRMVEFGTLSARLHRTVSVTCAEEEKRAEVTVENQEQELDTQVLDGMIEPLMHLLRNAVVHGIEPSETRRLLGKPESGQINIKLINEETHIVLKVSDDGRGIAASALKEKAFLTGLISREEADNLSYEDSLNLIFLPGLTTADKLSMSAGRGVGMSIVRESIEASDGTIRIESTPQKGTVFSLRLPLPLAVTNVLLVKVRNQTFALPFKLIKHIGEVPASNITENELGRTVELANSKYRFEKLAEYVGFSMPNEFERESLTTLLIETSDITCALMVDEILKSEEILIKPLGKPLDDINGLLGAAILANGETVPILDLPMLLTKKSTHQMPVLELAPQDEKPLVMVVDDSPSVRHMTSKIVENAGWNVVTAKDGQEAIEILDAGAKLPSIILTDVEMPRMDGYELVSVITAHPTFKSIPMVFITSRASEKHRAKAKELGIECYLTKPFDENELINTIKTLINAA